MQEPLDFYPAMRELILRHPGGRSDARALAELRRLCRAAAEAAQDAECAAALEAVQEGAKEFFSACGSGAWIRHQMLRQLERYRAARKPRAVRPQPAPATS